MLKNIYLIWAQRQLDFRPVNNIYLTIILCYFLAVVSLGSPGLSFGTQCQTMSDLSPDFFGIYLLGRKFLEKKSSFFIVLPPPAPPPPKHPVKSTWINLNLYKQIDSIFCSLFILQMQSNRCKMEYMFVNLTNNLQRHQACIK